MRSGQSPPQRPRARVAVVGGGVAGLTVAHRLTSAGQDHRAGQDDGEGQEGLEVVLLEQLPEVGGKLRSGQVGGLTLDLGAESVLARRPEALDLIGELGLTGEMEHPVLSRPGIWSRGRVHPLPAGTVMGVPGRPDALGGLLTPQEVARMSAEPDHPHPPVGADVSVGEWVGGRVGPAVVDRVVEPLLGGVYAGRADQLSLQATIPQLWPCARAGQPLLASVRALAPPARGDGAAQPPVFAGLRQGVSQLAGALHAAAVAGGAQVRTGTSVRALERRGHRWRLLTGPRPREVALDVDAVVLALPARSASRLLAGSVPAAAQELAGVEYASVAVLTVLVANEALSGVDGSGLLVPSVEGRLVKAVTFSSAKWAWVAAQDPALAVVRLSVGRVGEEHLLQRDDADLVAHGCRELAEMIGGPVRPVAWQVTRWGGSLPQYTVGHRDRVERVRREVAAAPGLAVCGAAYDGVGIAACVASAESAAAQVRAYLSAHPAGRADPAGRAAGPDRTMGG